VTGKSGLGQWRQSIAALFQDREIFMRTGGHVRFLKLSAQVQRRAAILVAIILAIWAAITLAMAINHALGASERAAVAAQKAAVAKQEARVAKYRDRVGEVAADLDERQAHLESLFDEHFGGEAAGTAVPKDAAAPTTDVKTTSALIDPSLPPEAQSLARLEARQEQFAASLLVAVNARAAKAEAAVAKLGLNPGAIVQNAASGRGGPFIPYTGKMGRAKAMGPAFGKLEDALFRMEVLERTLVAVPSGQPADVLMMSSGFGYRSDPFTGGGAMHSGLDFKGPHGTAILAAAPGVVTHAGPQSGYGYTIEIDHGQGMMTRYAHLSGFTARLGETVAAGQQVGRMGSTGRSTGTHLHFEVRLNGVAVNPRRFLEANKDVLEVKADARNRVVAVARAR
jgi:murein DD-endopeptidase MepM/ murein hydrolase activator NlpD